MEEESIPIPGGFRGSKKTNNRYFLQTKNIRRRDKRINSLTGNHYSPKAIDVSMPSPKRKKEMGTATSPRHGSQSGSPKHASPKWSPLKNGPPTYANSG